MIIETLVVAWACLFPGADARPPNIVVIYTDDQGWFDLGANGGRHVKTPHIDRMAEEGRRFTDFYTAQPVCSASRTALLTGLDLAQARP